MFNEMDYTHLKVFWEDKEKLDKIYEIIDDLNPFVYGYRYSFVLDFFFAMTAYKIGSDISGVHGIDRAEYMERIVLRANIARVLGCEYTKYVLVHQKMLIGLRIKRIISRIVVRSANSGGWGSHTYLSLPCSNGEKYSIFIG